MRKWIFASVLLLVAVALLYTFIAKNEWGFDPVQALPDEVLAMEEEEDALAGLDLASEDVQELESFFAKQQKLDFTPFIVKVPSHWQALGISMIDYDSIHVAMVRFHNPDDTEALFQFAFGGKLDQLAPSQRKSLDHFVYQPYVSNDLNLIVWQHNPNTLGMLVGHLATEDLANIVAHSGTSQ